MTQYVSTGRLPPNDTVATLVAEAHRRVRVVTEGNNSQVYPALPAAPANLFGVCVASTDRPRSPNAITHHKRDAKAGRRPRRGARAGRV